MFFESTPYHGVILPLPLHPSPPLSTPPHPSPPLPTPPPLQANKKTSDFTKILTRCRIKIEEKQCFLKIQIFSYQVFKFGCFSGIQVHIEFSAGSISTNLKSKKCKLEKLVYLFLVALFHFLTILIQ